MILSTGKVERLSDQLLELVISCKGSNKIFRFNIRLGGCRYMIAGFTYSAIKTKESWKNRCKRTLKEKYGKEPGEKGIQKEN